MGFRWESGLPAIVEAAAKAVAAGATDSDAVLAEALAQLDHHHRRKFGGRPAPLTTAPPVNGSNIDRLSRDLVHYALNNTQFFHPTSSDRPAIMLPWGTDWGFSEDAHINFRNMDKIIDYINANLTAELNATIRYGTLDGYLDLVHGSGLPREAPSQLAHPVVTGDFFPMDEECCQKSLVGKLRNCWTGYFSSFPTLKRALKVLQSRLRHAELMALLTENDAAPPKRWEALMGWGRHTAGILQHHDAITGTGGPSCNVEYLAMLANATKFSEKVVAEATMALTNRSDLRLEYYSTPPVAPPAVTSTVSHWPDDGSVLRLPRHRLNGGAPAQQQLGVPVVVTNPLAWNRTEAVEIKVNASSPWMTLVDGHGVPVNAQLAPPAPWNTSVAGPGSHVSRNREWAEWASRANHTDGPFVLSRLVFECVLPPLGASAYFLSSAASATGAVGSVAISRVEILLPNAGLSISNPKLKLEISKSGLIESATEHGSEGTLRLEQDFKLYWGDGGNGGNNGGPGSNPDGSGGDGGSQSDAYVFSPQGPATSVVGRPDTGFWPADGPSKPGAAVAGTVLINGPVMDEVSTAHTLFPEWTPRAGLWHASQLFTLPHANDGGIAENLVFTPCEEVYHVCCLWRHACL